MNKWNKTKFVDTGTSLRIAIGITVLLFLLEMGVASALSNSGGGHASVISSAQQPLPRMEDKVHFQVNLAPVLTTGIISDGIGPSNIIVTDLNQDSVTNIVACSSGSAYVLNKVTGDSYDTV